MESSDQKKVYYMFSDCKQHQCKCGTRATIAVEKNNDEINYGIAICQPTDNFSRTLGREIALKRLNDGFDKVKLPESFYKRYESEKDAILEFTKNIIASFEKNPKKWWHKVDFFTKRNGISQFLKEDTNLAV